VFCPVHIQPTAAVNKNITWSLKGNEEKDEDICMAAAGIKPFGSKISNVKTRRFWGEDKIE